MGYYKKRCPALCHGQKHLLKLVVRLYCFLRHEMAKIWLSTQVLYFTFVLV